MSNAIKSCRAGASDLHHKPIPNFQGPKRQADTTRVALWSLLGSLMTFFQKARLLAETLSKHLLSGIFKHSPT